MERSYLIQRLTKPSGGFLGMKDNPFAFGGGLVNGGLSADAMNVLRPIFSFDYMGAAEFEFGAVPRALSRIAEAAHNKPRKSKLTAFEFSFPLSEVEPNWRDRKSTAPDGDATVYVLCRKEHADEIPGRIREWAAGKQDRLKEWTHLSNTLRPHDEWDGKVVGWLELDNGFMFFTDRDMWAETAAVFAVDVDQAVSA